VPAEVPEGMLAEMREMGFDANRATRALHFTQGAGVEHAINWLMEHEGDADLDQPLLVPKVGVCVGCWCWCRRRCCCCGCFAPHTAHRTPLHTAHRTLDTANHRTPLHTAPPPPPRRRSPS
jgi:hypothetical protein